MRQVIIYGGVPTACTADNVIEDRYVDNCIFFENQLCQRFFGIILWLCWSVNRVVLCIRRHMIGW